MNKVRPVEKVRRYSRVQQQQSISVLTTDLFFATDHQPVNPRHSMALPMKVGRCGTSPRLNKFVRRLHDMLSKEKDLGLVEWRRGLLVLKSTGYFAKNILPKYFNTRNFKTFRRQLNYYGFVHIRSFSNAEQSTCALWANGELAKIAVAAGADPNDVSSVLLLRRVELADQATTNEMRRIRRELAISTIEKDLGISAKALQLQTLTSIGKSCHSAAATPEGMVIEHIINDVAGLGQPDRSVVASDTLSLAVDSVMYLPSHSSRPTVGFAGPPPPSSVVSATEDSALLLMDDAEDDPPVKAPPSNASAANLLLLLSRA
jgi:HSF-type DNA-binding